MPEDRPKARVALPMLLEGGGCGRPEAERVCGIGD